MKFTNKYALLTLIFGLFFANDGYTNGINSSVFTTIKTAKITNAQKTKDGRFKRKKGFMWGLFKGKNACSCPKH
jgi:hypothetical protein